MTISAVSRCSTTFSTIPRAAEGTGSTPFISSTRRVPHARMASDCLLLGRRCRRRRSATLPPTCKPRAFPATCAFLPGSLRFRTSSRQRLPIRLESGLPTLQLFILPTKETATPAERICLPTPPLRLPLDYKSGFQFLHQRLESGVHLADWVESGSALYRSGLSIRQQPGDRSSLDASDRRPAKHYGRYRRGLCCHLGITSTVSGNGDQGADPNQLVVVFDSLSNTDPTVGMNERFFTLRQARSGEVLRGVSITPGTGTDR